jgi:hypothetical protein
VGARHRRLAVRDDQCRAGTLAVALRHSDVEVRTLPENVRNARIQYWLAMRRYNAMGSDGWFHAASI